MSKRKAEQVYEALRPTPYERYAVVPLGYEYNDEEYERKGYGLPLKVYESRQQADKECEKLEHAARAKWGVDLEGYCEDCSWSTRDTCAHTNVRFYQVHAVEEVPFG